MEGTLKVYAPLEIVCTILYVFGFLSEGDSLKRNGGLKCLGSTYPMGESDIFTNIQW